MSKRLWKALVCLLALSVCGCAAPAAPQATGLPEPTTPPVRELRGSREAVEQCMALLAELYPDGVLAGYPLDEANCFNITPADFAERTQAQVFKFADICAAFVMAGGNLYPLGEYFGGYGVTDLMVWDPDGDGNPDILYTCSWGSGIHRAMAGSLNLVTGVSQTADAACYDGELMIVAQGEGFALYTADIALLDGRATDLRLTARERFGSVAMEDGKLVIQP